MERIDSPIRTRIVRRLERCVFDSPWDLRSAVERAGVARVSVESIHTEEGKAHFLVRPDHLGAAHVYARRRYPWHPYYVTGVEWTND